MANFSQSTSNLAVQDLSCGCETECLHDDTVDRVELKTATKMGIRKKLFDINAVQVDKKQKTADNYSLVIGSFPEDENDMTETEMLANMNAQISELEQDFLTRAKMQSISSGSVEKYFSNPDVVYRFGTGIALKCRLGYCEYSSMWKVYVFKRNLNFMPSIISISFVELEKVVSKLEMILKEIERGIQTGNYYLKPLGAEVEKWKPEKPDAVGFWTHPDVVCSDSGTLRIRPVWNFGSSYSIYINNPKTSKTYEAFCGPRVTLNSADIPIFVGILRKIINKCPSYEQMLDFIDKN